MNTNTIDSAVTGRRRRQKESSIEIPNNEREHFRQKYGDTGTHLQNLQHLQLNELNYIGFGRFSSVQKGYSEKYGQDIAVKIVNMRDKMNKLYTSKYLPNELRMWRDLSTIEHNNILTLRDCTRTKNYIYTITDALVHGDLGKFLLRYGMEESKSRHVVKGVANAVLYCHRNGIAHRDIKPANILLTEDLTPKLADFTFATRTNPVCKGQCGTQIMLAPEQCSRKPYNPFVSDIWQLGITIYMIIFRDIPYKNQQKKAILNEIKGLCGDQFKGVPIPTQVSENFKELIAGVLNVDPSLRLIIEEVSLSSWLSEES